MTKTIKVPTRKESRYREEIEGTATPLEKFISTWEPDAPANKSFRLMLESALNDIAWQVRGECEAIVNGRNHGKGTT